MADNNTIARPYAQALFELAHAATELAEWSAALDTARAFLADGQVVAYLGDPAFSNARRLEFLTGMFAQGNAAKLNGEDQQGVNFLKLLLENGRVAVLPEIAEHFEALKAKVENIVEVMVTAAVAISEDQQKQLAAALRERLGREINLATEINADLIGGAVIKAGDVVIDGSLRARLDGLANALIK
jgi:F-type H+-transporting ATPase subunit delta